MLTRIEVKGFKTLADVAVDLGAVNVFIGANGSGKSNLLEAIGFAGATAYAGLDVEFLHYRGIRLGSPASYLCALRAATSDQLSIKAYGERASYSGRYGPEAAYPTRWAIHDESVEIYERNTIRRSVNGFEFQALDHTWLFPVPNHSPSLPIRDAVYGLNGGGSNGGRNPADALAESFTLNTFLIALGQYAIFSPSTPYLRGVGGDVQREPLGLGGSGLGQAIEQMTSTDPNAFGPFDLDEVFELIEWANDLRVDSGNRENGASQRSSIRIGDRFMNASHRAVSATEASEGALYVLFLLALAGHDLAPRLFAVDNFDQALHPRLASSLTRMICDQIVKERSRQMFATTHNPLVLDGLDLLDDRIRLFTVERDSTGATQVQRITVTEELMAQANKGMSLSELWVMGRLGGVPKNL